MTDGPQVGTTGAEYRVPVERGKVREFARATRAHRETYRTDSDATIPPTWLAAGSFWTGADGLALAGTTMNWARILHGGQEYVFHGPPPRVGDELVAQQRIEDAYTKQGRRGGEMRFVVLVTDYRDATGRLVAEARSTVIETSKAAGT